MVGLRVFVIIAILLPPSYVTSHECKIEYGKEANTADEACETYWECKDYVGVAYKCPGGGQFDFKTNECKHNGDVWCQWQHQQLEVKMEDDYSSEEHGGDTDEEDDSSEEYRGHRGRKRQNQQMEEKMKDDYSSEEHGVDMEEGGSSEEYREHRGRQRVRHIHHPYQKKMKHEPSGSNPRHSVEHHHHHEHEQKDFVQKRVVDNSKVNTRTEHMVPPHIPNNDDPVVYYYYTEDKTKSQNDFNNYGNNYNDYNSNIYNNKNSDQYNDNNYNYDSGNADEDKRVIYYYYDDENGGTKKVVKELPKDNKDKGDKGVKLPDYISFDEDDEEFDDGFYNDLDNWGYVCRSKFGHEPNLKDPHCRSFWRCDRYKGSLIDCKSGLLYDYHAKACRDRRHVRCHGQHEQHIHTQPKHRAEVEKKDGGTTVVHHYYHNNK